MQVSKDVRPWRIIKVGEGLVWEYAVHAAAGHLARPAILRFPAGVSLRISTPTGRGGSGAPDCCGWRRTTHERGR